ncbi:YqaJ viral recombinase family protein [Gordonia polyisoprenivorans]|uniref:YqaJ viral recombinase family protein n=1 Tax=Gordonia polyisoprenivorans TaxID=84595 RepID=UPI00223452C8|nr:YqaJ viral recombinase family protein [Gordonia polyisoprenivorans]
MTLRIFPDVEQRSEEWYAQRRGIVTASIVGNLITTRKLSAIDYDCPKCGAVAGDQCWNVKHTDTIKTLHTERAAVAKSANSPTIIEPASNDTSRWVSTLLASERITGKTEDRLITNDMFRGINDEPFARDHYRQHCTDEPVTEVGFMVRDIAQGVRLGYSPDGLVGSRGLIEIKSRAPKTQVATVVSDTVPIENMPQLQAGLLVSGRDWIDYCSFAGGMAMWVIRVYPDKRWQSAIIEAVRRCEDNIFETRRIYDEKTHHLPLAPETAFDQEIML